MQNGCQGEQNGLLSLSMETILWVYKACLHIWGMFAARLPIGYKFNTLSANCYGICDFFANIRVILLEFITKCKSRGKEQVKGPLHSSFCVSLPPSGHVFLCKFTEGRTWQVPLHYLTVLLRQPSTVFCQKQGIELILPFLAMAELKKASFCSSGLTKWFRKRTSKFLAFSSPFSSVFLSHEKSNPDGWSKAPKPKGK